MRRAAIIAAVILVSLLLGALGAWLAETRTADTAARGGDFTLTSADGPATLADQRGRVVLIYFGYASCPDICPTSLAFITAALRALTPAELERVRVVFISVDPARDTPEKLKQYAGHFHPNIIGVTGSPGTLADVATRYGAVLGINSRSPNSMCAPDSGVQTIEPERCLRHARDSMLP